MEAKLKHLEFIQATINRMSSNSFLLKGWAITIIGGLFALTFKETNCTYIYFSSMLLIFFALLDSYYLSRERLFIKLYNQVRKEEEPDIKFSMDISKFKSGCDWCDALFSTTTGLFYGGLLITQFLIIYFI
jgi:hypothetical protein